MSFKEGCLFCKIVKGSIPCYKLLETPKALSFLDINPVTNLGHALIIPKHHAEKLGDLPEEAMTDILPMTKKLILALGLENYNLLQNNGKSAHQEIGHVHFHLIPKPCPEEGLYVGWPIKSMSKSELESLHVSILAKLSSSSSSSS